VQAIVITASSSLETAIEALRARVFDYLTKPLDSLVMFEITVTRALRHGLLKRDNRRLFAELQKLATTDHLTGLFNRRTLFWSLQREVDRAKGHARPLSVIMLDMDDLKAINDRHGHPAGDQALVQVSHAIRSETRRLDIASRLGGDEFLVVLPETDADQAKTVAGRVLRRIVSSRVNGKPLSVSIGIAQLCEAHSDMDALMRAADRALYQAKGSGGQRISVAGLEGEYERHKAD
jgi:diguanylate cyclase (GGDEF)-like protein